MSKLNEREERLMITHAREECAQHVIFFSEIIYFRIISTVSMASAVRNRRCPWKLEWYRVVCLP